MSDAKNRYYSGPQTQIKLGVASATVINKGDMVYLSDGKAAAYSSTYDASSAAAAIKEAAADVFCGVAQESSASGETDDILVDISNEAIYQMDLQAAADCSVGDWLTIYTGVSSDGMDPQKLVADTTGSYGMFVCVEDHASAAGTLLQVKMLPQKIFNKAPDVDE